MKHTAATRIVDIAGKTHTLSEGKSYHIGASLKDLGKGWFVFGRLGIGGEGKCDGLRFLLEIFGKGSGKMLIFAD